MRYYFVAVVPHRELRKKAKVYSRDFAERFYSLGSYKNFPHITLIKPFPFDESQEDVLIEQFSEMDLKTTPFNVNLKDFGCFPNKDNPVIFIKPEIRENFRSYTMRFSRK